MDSKAVSPLIGFVLLLAIIMGFIGIVQSSWVPEWNKAVEAEHLDEVSYEVAELSEVVSLAASTGNPAKIVIDAGVKYPEYYILISPSKAAGSVGKRELWVNISGIAGSTSYTKNFTTYAITYKPNYLYSSSPELVFEHSAVLKMENSYLVVNSDQSSFTRSKITLYLINATFNPFSTTDNINLVFYPISYGGSTRFSGTIEFVCYDERTASWWNETLSSIYGSDNVTQDGRKITLNVNNVELSINYFVATATSAGEVEIVSEMSPAELQPLSESSYTVYEGTTVPLGVRVVDNYRNPVRNVPVEVKLDGSTVATLNSNINGEVWFYHQAVDTGDHHLVFSTSFDSESYQIEVIERPSPTGIFSVSWVVGDRYDWDVSLEGSMKEFKVQVSYAGAPLSNVTVDIATDNSSVISFLPAEGKTDNNGELAITVIALSNGTANLIASAGGSVAILELNITNAGMGICPAGWAYYRDIEIQNNADQELRDFQVLITLNAAEIDYQQSDCSDIVFYNGSQRLERWIVDGTCGSSSIKIWVKVPYIPANGVATIRMFYGSPYSVPNSINTFDVVGEAGVTSVGGVEKSVSLSSTFSNPTVFAVPRLDAGVERSGSVSAQHHLITSISSNSFTIKQVESPSAGGGTITETEVAYLVLEKGIYYIGYDLLAEVGTIQGSGNYKTVNLQAPFSSTPAVLADVQERAKQGNNYYEDVYARVRDTTLTSFQVQIERDDNSNPPPSLTATLAYAAMQQGYDELNNFEAEKTSDSITHQFSQIWFTDRYSAIPSVVAQLVSEDGGHSAYAVTRDITTSGFEVAVEEPASWDGRHTTEEIAWVASHQGLIYGRKYVDTLPTVSVGAEQSCT